MLTRMNPYSFVEQDFIWIGEYADGTHLSEYNELTKMPEDFYKLRRDILTRFGLVGHGVRLYFEVYGGFFHIRGQLYELVYKVGEKEYYLTGQSRFYNDVIQYKDAESWANFTEISHRNFPSRITAYNVGYKIRGLEVDGVTFNVKPILTIPYNEPAFFDITLVADRELDGKLIIKKNGSEIAEFHAPLKEGVGWRLLKWSVR